MTQFCALLLGIYALLAPQRGGPWHNAPPPKYPLIKFLTAKFFNDFNKRNCLNFLTGSAIELNHTNFHQTFQMNQTCGGLYGSKVILAVKDNPINLQTAKLINSLVMTSLSCQIWVWFRKKSDENLDNFTIHAVNPTTSNIESFHIKSDMKLSFMHKPWKLSNCDITIDPPIDAIGKKRETYFEA